VDQEMQPEIIT